MFEFFRKHQADATPQSTVPETPGGIYLGRYLDRETMTYGDELDYQGGHAILFGPSGAGKGARILVQNLLRIRHASLIVLDPKGELAAITAEFRRTLGPVHILNPFKVLGIEGVGVNPLADLNPDSETFFDDCAGVAEAIIPIEEKEPHWTESAEALWTAGTMWEVQSASRDGREPSLANVRRLLSEPDEFVSDGDGKRRQVKGLRVTVARTCAMGGYEMQSLIGRFLRDNNEIAGIQSTTDRVTRFLLSQPIRSNLARNDVNFADAKEQISTTYLVLPAERLRTHKAWLRLIFVTALRQLYRPGGLPVIFLVDEASYLGHLGPIEDAFALARGFGVSMFLVYQDLPQLRAAFKDKADSLLANAGVVIGLPPNDAHTAEWMSLRTGDTTVVAAGYNQGDSHNPGGQGQSEGINYHQAKRRLFLPQELMDLGEGCGLIWPAGTSKAIPFYAPAYWEDPAVAHLAAPNPYHELRGRPRSAA